MSPCGNQPTARHGGGPFPRRPEQPNVNERKESLHAVQRTAPRVNMVLHSTVSVGCAGKRPGRERTNAANGSRGRKACETKIIRLSVAVGYIPSVGRAISSVVILHGRREERDTPHRAAHLPQFVSVREEKAPPWKCWFALNSM